MTSGPIIVRADADASIGTGHVMRCLAVAQAFEDRGIQTVFVTRPLPGKTRERLAHEFQVMECIATSLGSQDDARLTGAIAAERNSERVLMDGVRFDDDYARVLRDRRLSIAAIDDYATCPRRFCNLTINQNVYAGSLPSTSGFLGGLSYALLRRDLRRREGAVSERRDTVLISMGGSDPDQLTGTLIECLTGLVGDDLTGVAIVGGANPMSDALVRAYAGGPIALSANVSSLAPYFARTRLAVLAAGGTLWEAMHWGVAIIAVYRDEAQRRSVDWLMSEELIAGAIDARSVVLSDVRAMIASALGDPARQQRADRAQRMVDGLGADRVAARMMEMQLDRCA